MRNTWMGLVLLAACGKQPAGDSAASAKGRLHLVARPAAEIVLDGTPVGHTPLSLDCEPGAHEIVLKAEGFLDYRAELEVAAGATMQVDRDLVVRDPTDPLVLGRVARAFELELEGLDELERHRGAGGEDQVWVLYPRDTLRPDDLTDFRIDVGAEFETPGTLEFRKGSTVLHKLNRSPMWNEVLARHDAVPPKARDRFGKRGKVR